MAVALPSSDRALSGIPVGARDPVAARHGASMSLAPEDATPRFVPPEDLDPNYRVQPSATLLCLALSLLGFVDIAYQIYALKFLGDTTYIHGIPSRVLFVLGMTLVAAPVILSVFRRTHLLFIAPAVVLVFFLYPLFNLYGIPAGQDAIFNYQFAFSLLENGRWIPGGGTTLQAIAYAYYPGSGVFNAELSAFTGIPLVQTFLWGVPLMRLLIFPPTIYALASRYLGERVGMVSVMIFLATPSILFNYPVQSEFAIPFFALTLMMLGYAVVASRGWQAEAMIAVVLFAGFVVMSHHLTSYILTGWAAGLAFLWVVFHRFRGVSRGRALALFGVYFVMLALFTYTISLPNFEVNVTSLLYVFGEISHPFSLSSGTATTVGSSFPEYELAWSYLAYLLLVVIGLLALRRWLTTERRSFITPNLLVALLVVILTIPLLATAFAFLPQRILEYGEPFIAPAVAWWLVQRFLPRPTSSPRPRQRTVRRTAPSPARRFAVSAGVLLLVVLIFTGGSLVPFSTRDQFAPADAISTGSPLNIDRNSYDLGVWARAHLTASTYIWGDTLTVCVFGGFGQFNMVFDQYMLFAGSTIPLSVWQFVPMGSYVVIDKLMTTTTPQFPGPFSDQPTAPLTEAQISKFNNPANFDVVYQDSMFTIYQVIAIP